MKLFCKNNTFLTNGDAGILLSDVFKEKIGVFSSYFGFPSIFYNGNDPASVRALRDFDMDLKAPGSACGDTIRCVSDFSSPCRVRCCLVGNDDDFVLSDRAADPVDVFRFVSVLVAINHERQHLIQETLDCHTSSSVGKIMASSLFACGFSDLYHWNNYDNLPQEVDAQGVALYNTYLDLESLCGDVRANEYLCFYQNERIRLGSGNDEPDRSDGRSGLSDIGDIDTIRFSESDKPDFVAGSGFGLYAYWQDIVHDFEDEFRACVHKRRAYDMDLGRSIHDELAVMLDHDKGFKRRFEYEKDGFDQDLLVASSYFSLHFSGDYYESVVQYVNNKVGLVFKSDSIPVRNRLQQAIRRVPTFDASYSIEDRVKAGNRYVQAMRDADELTDSIGAGSPGELNHGGPR